MFTQLSIDRSVESISSKGRVNNIWQFLIGWLWMSFCWKSVNFISWEIKRSKTIVKSWVSFDVQLLVFKFVNGLIKSSEGLRNRLLVSEDYLNERRNRFSYRLSFIRPASTTKTQSSIVMEVSAKLVPIMIFRTSSPGLSNILLCIEHR